MRTPLDTAWGTIICGLLLTAVLIVLIHHLVAAV